MVHLLAFRMGLAGAQQKLPNRMADLPMFQGEHYLEGQRRMELLQEWGFHSQVSPRIPLDLSLRKGFLLSLRNLELPQILSLRTQGLHQIPLDLSPRTQGLLRIQLLLCFQMEAMQLQGSSWCSLEASQASRRCLAWKC